MLNLLKEQQTATALKCMTSELTVQDLLDHSGWAGGVTQPARLAGVDGADQLGHSFLNKCSDRSMKE